MRSARSQEGFQVTARRDCILIVLGRARGGVPAIKDATWRKTVRHFVERDHTFARMISIGLFPIVLLPSAQGFAGAEAALRFL
jgi:hypothetical protein